MYLKYRKFFSTAVLLVSIVLLQPYTMQAQQTLGGITGTVVDPSGSAVPGAEIKATSEDTKLERTAQSNAQGSYVLNDLPIGKYTVTFTKDGFSTERYPEHPGAGGPHSFAASPTESRHGSRLG